jgi:hypothetical protein
MKLASIVTGLALVGGVAQAQTVVTAKLTAPYAPGGTAVTSPFGYYMSPYSGTVDGGPQYRFNCVDYFHEVTVGETWQATQTNLGSIVNASQAGQTATLNDLLSNTRYGAAYSPSVAVSIYQQAALLTTMYTTNPGSNATRSSAIQTAIWEITSPGFPDAQRIGVGSADENTTGFWIQYAADNYQKQAVGFYDQFNILSDLNQTVSGNQEFIYATPEPATLVLLATGFLAIGGVAMRRRKRDGAMALQA